MARQVIIRLEEKNLLVETDFSEEELSEVAEKIQDALLDDYSENKTIEELQKKGYLKVIGEAPEIYELYLI